MKFKLLFNPEGWSILNRNWGEAKVIARDFLYSNSMFCFEGKCLHVMPTGKVDVLWDRGDKISAYRHGGYLFTGEWDKESNPVFTQIDAS